MDTNVQTLIDLLPQLVVIIGLLVAAVLVIVGGLVFVVTRFNTSLKESVPANFGEQLLSVTRQALLITLNQGAAKTPQLDDDEFLINLLRIGGSDVSGSPETGYTIVVPPVTAKDAVG